MIALQPYFPQILLKGGVLTELFSSSLPRASPHTGAFTSEESAFFLDKTLPRGPLVAEKWRSSVLSFCTDEWRSFFKDPHNVETALEVFADLIGGVAKNALKRFERWYSLSERCTIVGGIFATQVIPEFDPDLGSNFEAFARRLMSLRFIDEVRPMDPLKRDDRAFVENVSRALNSLEQRRGEKVALEDPEVYLNYLELQRDQLRGEARNNAANRPEFDVTGYRKFLERSRMYFHSTTPPTYLSEDWAGENLENLFHPRVGDPAPDPSEEVEGRTFISHCIEKLSDQERAVVYLYDYHDLSMRQVAELMHLSESRVARVHRCAIDHMKRIARYECGGEG